MSTLSRPLYGHIETEMTTFSSIFVAIFEKKQAFSHPLYDHLENEITTFWRPFYGHFENEMTTFSPIFMGHLENEMTWHLDLAPLFKAIFKIKAAIIMGPLENEMATLTRPLYGHLENEPTTFSRIFYGPCRKLNDNI